MRVSTTALLTLLSFTPLTLACWKDGESWYNRNAALSAASADCNALQGALQKGEGRRVCSDGDRQSYEFIVRYTGELPGRTLTYNECFAGFSTQIKGCEKGGANHDKEWEWRAKPIQLGKCQTTK